MRNKGNWENRFFCPHCRSNLRENGFTEFYKELKWEDQFWEVNSNGGSWECRDSGSCDQFDAFTYACAECKGELNDEFMKQINAE